MTFQTRWGVPQCTLEDFETAFAGRHVLHRIVSEWARHKPEAPAVISYDRGQAADWATLDRASSILALDLLRRGFRKGDFLAAVLPMSLEHIYLEYACFKIGVVHAPLDLRLRPPEVLRCLEQIRPRGFAFLPPELAEPVRTHSPFVSDIIPQSMLAEIVARDAAPETSGLQAAFETATAAVGEDDGAQVIFTTGSTGPPKPALLSHRNITCQNLCLGAAFSFGEDTRLLLNLPPSHVGGQAEALMTALFWGGTVIALEVFDPAKSLDAIRRHRANILGQIPAMFQFEWRLSDYGNYDLSSLQAAIYGGQQASRQFLERMAQMAPVIGTGLGLTETAGFCTYTPASASADEIFRGIGFDMPVYPMSIRRPMRDNGAAGEALPDGEVGHICFRGPQSFLGYVNDPAATARTISSDGFLYSGDIGWRDENGLHLSGRARWVIKPAGHQVFPGDIENHYCALEDRIACCAAVGAEHRLLSEAVVAFVEKKPGADFTIAELRRHAKGIASYMRPLHYVILEPGQMPLNRAAKIDYLRLSERARAEVDQLRVQGRWDR
ncbi:MAG: class I adenylate-forming enzyme family protein [Acidobacteriota bacterium]